MTTPERLKKKPFPSSCTIIWPNLSLNWRALHLIRSGEGVSTLLLQGT